MYEYFYTLTTAFHGFLMCVLLYRLLLEKDAFLSLHVLSLIHTFVANVTITRLFVANAANIAISLFWE